MKLNNLILIIVLTFLFPLVNAEVNELDSVPQNSCVLIPQTCASCSYVNVSVTYKNQTIITNKGMANQGGGLWTYNFCNTSQLGRYDIQGSGDIEGNPTGFDILYFEVSYNGFVGTTGFYILIIILSLGLITLGVYMQDIIVVAFGALGLYFMGFYILFNGINGLRDPVYTFAMGIIIIGLASYISIKAGLELIVD